MPGDGGGGLRGNGELVSTGYPVSGWKIKIALGKDGSDGCTTV